MVISVRLIIPIAESSETIIRQYWTEPGKAGLSSLAHLYPPQYGKALFTDESITLESGEVIPVEQELYVAPFMLSKDIQSQDTSYQSDSVGLLNAHSILYEKLKSKDLSEFNLCRKSDSQCDKMALSLKTIVENQKQSYHFCLYSNPTKNKKGNLEECIPAEKPNDDTLSTTTYLSPLSGYFTLLGMPMDNTISTSLTEYKKAATSWWQVIYNWAGYPLNSTKEISIFDPFNKFFIENGKISLQKATPTTELILSLKQTTPYYSWFSFDETDQNQPIQLYKRTHKGRVTITFKVNGRRHYVLEQISPRNLIQ